MTKKTLPILAATADRRGVKRENPVPNSCVEIQEGRTVFPKKTFWIVGRAAFAGVILAVTSCCGDSRALEIQPASETLPAVAPVVDQQTQTVSVNFLKPMLALASPDQAVSRFLDFLAKIFLILGSLIIAYGAYLIHQGRVAEGLLGLLGGFILALAIPLMRFFLSIAGITV